MQINLTPLNNPYTVTSNKKPSNQIGFNGQVSLNIPRILINKPELCKEAKYSFKAVKGLLKEKADLNNLDILFNLCVNKENKVGLFCTIREHKNILGSIPELISKMSGNVTVPFNKDSKIFISSATEAIDRFYNPVLYKKM
jgi:hypothetical protein